MCSYFYKLCTCSSQWSQKCSLWQWSGLMCCVHTGPFCSDGAVWKLLLNWYGWRLHFYVTVLEGHQEGGRVGASRQNHALQAGTAQCIKDKWCDTPFYSVIATMNDNLVTYPGGAGQTMPALMWWLCCVWIHHLCHLESFSELITSMAVSILHFPLSDSSPGRFQRGLFKVELEYRGIMSNLAMWGTAKNCGINKEEFLTEPLLTGGLTNSAANRSVPASGTLTPGPKKPLWQQIPVSPAMQEGGCSPSHPLAKLFQGPSQGHSLCSACTEITIK